MLRYIHISNGVKKGGVFYIFVYIYRLSQSGYCCKIGHLYYGRFGYTYDVSLVAPSIYTLHRMCDIALGYASEYSLTH